MDTKSKTEIAQVEHELDNLRASYRLLERSADIAKYATLCFVIALFATTIYAMFVDQPFVILATMGIFFFLVLKFCTGGSQRWIDFVSWSPPFARTIWNMDHRESEAQAIERMIAEREERLRTLTKPN
jgi:hypothetical protein